MWTHELLFLFLIFVFARPINAKIVSTVYGQIEGFTYTTPSGPVTDIFLGIPFGKSRRFEKPRAVQPWSGVLCATKFSSSCYNTLLFTQIAERVAYLSDDEVPTFKHYSEDCLTLNVMAPSVPCERGYPVLVVVNGGAFELSGAALTGYKTLSINFVTKGIICVSVNYRFGPLGYLSAENEKFPGNYGLWDRHLALLFVRKVIRSFGGNPHEITVIGEGSVVSALSLSPHTNGLFKRAIAIGGSMFSQTNLGSNCRNDSDHLANHFDCYSPTFCANLVNSAMGDFQRAVTETGFVNDRLDYLSGMRFVPRIDGDFFPESLENLIKKAPQIPTIAGVTQCESAMLNLFTLFEGNRRFVVPRHKQSEYSKLQLIELINSLDDSMLRLELISFYAHRRTEGSEREDARFYLKLQAELASDILFNIPIYYEATLKASLGHPVYLYVEEFSTLPTSAIPINLTTYGNIKTYIYGTFLGGVYQFSDNNVRYQKNVLDGFASFITTGVPSVSGKAWLPITSQNKDRYMAFDVKSRMKDGFHKRKR